jgi:kumamolisin
VDPNEHVEVSVILRPRRPLEEVQRAPERPLSREEFAAIYGAAPSDLAAIEMFARQHGLEVVESSADRRTVRLAGRAADVGAAFGVDLRQVRAPDGSVYRAPTGEVLLPAELRPLVEGVFGLDTRPVARHHG